MSRRRLTLLDGVRWRLSDHRSESDEGICPMQDEVTLKIRDLSRIKLWSSRMRHGEGYQTPALPVTEDNVRLCAVFIQVRLCAATMSSDVVIAQSLDVPYLSR